MQSTRVVVGKSLVITLEGRLDVMAAKELEKEYGDTPEGTESVILDLALLKYISSAGLRVIVKAKKDLEERGIELSIRNTQKDVMDVFKMTRFDEILNIS